MHITEDKLKSILIDSGLVDEKNFSSIKEESFRSGQTVIDTIIGRGLVPEDYVAELLQPYFGVKKIDLKKLNIPTEILELVPEAYAKSKSVIVFEIDKTKSVAKVAMVDPFDLETVEYLRAKLGMWVEVYLSTASDLHFGLKQYKKKIGVEFNKIITENIEKSISMVGETDLSKMAGAIPVVTILDSIIEHAVSLGTSDIHFEPLEKEVLIRYRVDGIMHEILSLPKIIAPILAARVKVLSNLLIDEHRVPQDGRFKFEVEDIRIDVRVNIMPVFHGEKVEMRLLRSTARPTRLEDLGLSSENVEIVMEEIKKPHGMILVTGPTGHGKTTTLYTILQLLNSPKVNITTIEDPIEYELARVNQTQVNQKSGITFANGLRSLMRQNPDIIMVGEIRDNETIDISIHAALTGHLLLSTIHTNDAPTTIPRILDMGAPPFLLASTLNVIIAQRLVRKICTSCIMSYPTPPEAKKLIKAQIDSAKDDHIKTVPARLFKGQGCKVCGNSGFHGQIGIFEVLKSSEPMRSLILKQVPASEIRALAIKEGMQSLFADGIKKVERGITTLEEVMRVVRE
jgi:type IV pilus assembly protein PilB